MHCIHCFWSLTGAFLPAAAAQERDPRVKVFLIDPPGSGLYNKVG